MPAELDEVNNASYAGFCRRHTRGASHICRHGRGGQWKMTCLLKWALSARKHAGALFISLSMWMCIFSQLRSPTFISRRANVPRGKSAKRNRTQCLLNDHPFVTFCQRDTAHKIIVKMTLRGHKFRSLTIWYRINFLKSLNKERESAFLSDKTDLSSQNQIKKPCSGNQLKFPKRLALWCCIFTNGLHKILHKYYITNIYFGEHFTILMNFRLMLAAQCSLSGSFHSHSNIQQLLFEEFPLIHYIGYCQKLLLK